MSRSHKCEEEMTEVGRVYWRNKWLINYVVLCITIMTIASIIGAIRGGN